jgi:hypothetical protein
MKRIKIESSTRGYRPARRDEPLSTWNEWIDDETDLRKLAATPKPDKVRRGVTSQSIQVGR